MRRKVIFVFVVLTFAIVSSSYGYVLGDWEGSSMDGWAQSEDFYPPGNPTLTPGQTVGVTLNDNSLLMVAPIEPEPTYWDMCLDLTDDYESRAAFMANTTFEVDVTRLTDDWMEDTDPNTVTMSTFIITIWGGGPAGGFNVQPVGLCPWNGEDSTQTLSFDYADAIVASGGMLDAGWYMEIEIGTQNVGWEEGGVYYLDNARIVPEPMTIALLGIGGLGLLRRKR
ncbi:MAG: PEP-CTERM sorting domain-containing protein [Phycisphaerae bacterium]|jgi:hypothetical protein